jgi:hypothetical protein
VLRRQVVVLVVVALAALAAPASSTPSSQAVIHSILDYGNACQGASVPPSGFADAGLAADCLRVYGVALGKVDGTFGEDDMLRRSQVSSLLVRLMQAAGTNLSRTHSFPDVNKTTVPDDQVRHEIELLTGSGIIVGFPDGAFHPGEQLTVTQGAALVVRTLAFLHDHDPRIPAFADQGSTAADYDFAVDNQLLLDGSTDVHGAIYDTSREGMANRGVLAEMLAQALQVLVDARAIAPIGQGHATGQLGPGLEVATFAIDGPNVVHLVAVDRSKGVEIRSTLATGRLTGRLPTTSISRRWHAAVAVNGDFFLANGEPAHPFATGGRLLKAPANIEDSMGFSETDPQTAYYGTPSPIMWATVPETGAVNTVELFNDGAPAPDQLALFTREGASATSPPADSCYARTVPVLPPQLNEQGSATQLHLVTATGCAAEPPTVGDDDLLVATAGGSRADFIKAIQPGQHVDLGWSMHPAWSGLFDSTGSNTTLVHNGAPSTDVIVNDGPFYETLAPRTAVGQLADGRDVLVTVDGRQPGYSIGMTPYQFAELLVSFGVVEATNLDGGGSTTLVMGGRLVNRPSDAAGERPVGTALVVVATGTPDPPPTVGVQAPPPDANAELNDPASWGGYSQTLHPPRER